MKNKKLHKWGIKAFVLAGLCGQAGTSYSVYLYNETAGAVIAGLFVYCDVGLFLMLGMASNEHARKWDRVILLTCSFFIALFAVSTIVQALNGADEISRHNKKQELIELNKSLASTAGNQAALSSNESANRMEAIKSNPKLQSNYTGQALQHSKVAAKSLDQAGVFVRNSEKLINAKTAREIGLANLDGWLKWAYLTYAALIVVLIPSLLFHYGQVFGRRIDAINAKLTESEANLTSSNGGAFEEEAVKNNDIQVSYEYPNLSSNQVRIEEVEPTNLENVIKFQKYSSEAEAMAKKIISLIGTKDQVKPSQPEIKKHFKGSNGGDQKAKEIQQYLIEYGYIKPKGISSNGKPTGYEYVEKVRAV